MNTETGTWWTAPAESEETGRTIMVTGRKDVERFRSNPRFNIRVEVTWRYESPTPGGMPSEADAEMMEQVQEALQKEFRKDPVAVLTGIYTGDGRRDWIFYTLSTHIFGRKLNETLAPFPLLPLTVYCENDPGWEEYDEMSKAEIKMD
jgi:acetylornithine deacetylase/succinyl-diaminopimelate desuccinylase-like protein